MFGKGVVLVLALGACGCTLLAMRQSRLQAASELVQIQLKIRQQDEHLWMLRTRIGSEVTPDHVREMAAGIGPLRPIWPAVPGVRERLDTRQVVEIPAPAKTPAGAPAPQTKPAAPPSKGKADPKRDRAQPPRARLAISEPQR